VLTLFDQAVRASSLDDAQVHQVRSVKPANIESIPICRSSDKTQQKLPAVEEARAMCWPNYILPIGMSENIVMEPDTAARSSQRVFATPLQSGYTRKPGIIYPRRKKFSQSSDDINRPVQLSRKHLESLMHLPIPSACKEVGVCATTFKKACRRQGIHCWPYRRGISFSRTSSDSSGNHPLNESDPSPVPEAPEEELSPKVYEVQQYPTQHSCQDPTIASLTTPEARGAFYLKAPLIPEEEAETRTFMPMAHMAPPQYEGPSHYYLAAQSSGSNPPREDLRAMSLSSAMQMRRQWEVSTQPGCASPFPPERSGSRLTPWRAAPQDSLPRVAACAPHAALYPSQFT
jgi:hypothetical protein